MHRHELLFIFSLYAYFLCFRNLPSCCDLYLVWNSDQSQEGEKNPRTKGWEVWYQVLAIFPLPGLFLCSLACQSKLHGDKVILLTPIQLSWNISLLLIKSSFLEVVEPGLSCVDSVEDDCCPWCIWLLGASSFSHGQGSEHLCWGVLFQTPLLLPHTLRTYNHTRRILLQTIR